MVKTKYTRTNTGSKLHIIDPNKVNMTLCGARARNSIDRPKKKEDVCGTCRAAAINRNMGGDNNE